MSFYDRRPHKRHKPWLWNEDHLLTRGDIVCGDVILLVETTLLSFLLILITITLYCRSTETGLMLTKHLILGKTIALPLFEYSLGDQIKPVLITSLMLTGAVLITCLIAAAVSQLSGLARGLFDKLSFYKVEFFDGFLFAIPVAIAGLLIFPVPFWVAYLAMLVPSMCISPAALDLAFDLIPDIGLTIETRRKRAKASRRHAALQAEHAHGHSTEVIELCYQTLGVTHGATPSQIRDAFLFKQKLYDSTNARRLGPRGIEDAEKCMQEIQLAYDCLSGVVSLQPNR